MANAERVLGNVGTGVLLENDRVKVWELKLEPGERSDLHRHEHDYILVQITGDHIEGHFEPDSEGLQGVLKGVVSPGRCSYIPKGGIETAANTGEKAYYEILIELK